jgi:hypothetical protein
MLLVCIAPYANATTASEGKKESAQAVVQRLYQDYSWVTTSNPSQGRRDLVAESEEVLTRYFTGALAKLIRQDFECARQSSAICNLDFDPIYASQDPQMSGLRILRLDKEQHVWVHFTYPSTGQKIRVQYKMEFENRGWRIRDICYKNTRCLRQILEHPVQK